MQRSAVGTREPLQTGRPGGRQIRQSGADLRQDATPPARGAPCLRHPRRRRLGVCSRLHTNGPAVAGCVFRAAVGGVAFRRGVTFAVGLGWSGHADRAACRPRVPGPRRHAIPTTCIPAPTAASGTRASASARSDISTRRPATVEEIPLGAGSAPHGVIVGPDGAPWITDGGLNAIVRVDPTTHEVTIYPLPADRPDANLNTATFDGDGRLWFTGQNGIYGSLDPATGEMEVYDDPEGRGPYGIDATPDGDVWYSSLAGSHLGAVDLASGGVTLVDPPTAGAGARRVWSDSGGRLWVSEWNAGQVAVHDPSDGSWQEWPLPGDNPMTYAVYVDENDIVWLTDFGANAIVRFDPTTEEFETITLPTAEAAVRQLAGRPGEIWGAESGCRQARRRDRRLGVLRRPAR